jgi:hypothetical protein
LLPRLALNFHPSDVFLPSSWDYRHELPYLALRLICLLGSAGKCEAGVRDKVRLTSFPSLPPDGDKWHRFAAQDV